MRMRPDLVVSKVPFGQRTYWSIKDPVSLRFFQLREEEFFILRSLDGRTPLDDVRRRFETLFAPLQLDQEKLRGYLGSLVARGLVVTESENETDSILARRQALNRNQRLSVFSNLFAIRFRGIDPERWLRSLYPLARPLLSRWVFASSLLLIVAAILLVVVQLEAVVASLPSFTAFFSPSNLLWIVLAIGVSKVLHEFGHAFTCKHFGGECHEMGVMLLVFTPCLYCDVSDAWLMPEKWRRIAISGAGIYVEAVLAAVGTFLWWYSEPGLLNTISLNIALVCSMNTVLFNGNPLLRYDGYYVLADLVEVPNLRQRASQLLAGTAKRVFLGIPSSDERQLPARGRRLLLLYAIVAAIYRLIVIVGILWFLHAVLEPHGLRALAQVATVLFLGSIAIVWMTRAAKFARTVRQEPVRPRRLITVGLVAAGLVVFALLVPLPRTVVAPLVIDATDADTVYVSVGGRVPIDDASRLAVGDRVQRGDPIVQLENTTLENELIELEGRVRTLRSRVRSLTALEVRSETAATLLPSTKEALRDAEEQLRQRDAQRRRLRLDAPTDGIILPAEARQQVSTTDELPTWDGHPLQAKNAGATLEAGTPLCVVGDPSRLSATIVVDQTEIDLVERGQQVTVWLRQVPGVRLPATVAEISTSPIERVPRALVESGDVPIMPSELGEARPASASFTVRAPLASPDDSIPLRSTGWVRIRVAPQSAVQRLLRYLASTFRFAH